MPYEKDDLWGSSGRRPLPRTRIDSQAGRVWGGVTPPDEEYTSHLEPEEHTSPFGPEAQERAHMMTYERIKKIQQESPYAREDVIEVEHVVHDYRLYVGMWIVAGVSAVSAFLTYSVACVIITLVALAFALSATPGRQKKRIDAP